MATRTTKSWITVMVVLAVLIGAAFGVRALWNTAKDHFSSDSCTVGSFDLDPDQAAVASTMVGAVTQYRVALPERASVLAIAAALQESKLTNLAPDAGDRDSVGVLQQRPSQGWGTDAQLQDVHYATGKFLDALVKIDGWQTMALADAIQKVQISIDGSYYARHEDEAQALSDALTGKTPAGLSCSFAEPTEVASAATVAAAVSQD